MLRRLFLVKRADKGWTDMASREIALLQALRERIEAIHDSVARYSPSRSFHAPQVALVLRTLLNDTKKEKALLSKLELRDRIRYCDTGCHRPESAEGKTWSFMPVGVSNSGPEFLFRAPLDYHHVDFDQWWNGVVIIRKGVVLSRSDVVTNMANKQWAHVDDSVPEHYGAADTKMLYDDIIYDDAAAESPDITTRAAACRIAIELNESLILEPSLVNTLGDVPSLFCSEVTAEPGQSGFVHFIKAASLVMGEGGAINLQRGQNGTMINYNAQPSRTRASMNSLCPCGSGRKYKRCHGIRRKQ